jgi:hypothetical protein
MSWFFNIAGDPPFDIPGFGDEVEDINVNEDVNRKGHLFRSAV